mmetsp:Transcript_9778/g.27358  ORF Transcript_9778/g.27358 Transcript_9778/m.27358 type:complete len:211 (-) Transcript_9778:431-1063(-)
MSLALLDSCTFSATFCSWSSARAWEARSTMTVRMRFSSPRLIMTYATPKTGTALVRVSMIGTARSFQSSPAKMSRNQVPMEFFTDPKAYSQRLQEPKPMSSVISWTTGCRTSTASTETRTSTTRIKMLAHNIALKALAMPCSMSQSSWKRSQVLMTRRSRTMRKARKTVTEGKSFIGSEKKMRTEQTMSASTMPKSITFKPLKKYSRRSM